MPTTWLCKLAEGARWLWLMGKTFRVFVGLEATLVVGLRSETVFRSLDAFLPP
jgi:hypothetical protein